MADKELTIEKQEKVKFIELSIIDVDEESVFVRIQDWRMRVYFEDKAVNPIKQSGIIKVEYIGDLADILNLKLLPLKK